MASPQNSPSSTAATEDIKEREEKLKIMEEKLDVLNHGFKLEVLLMILSYVNKKFQDTAPSLIQHLKNLKDTACNSYSGIINYTFKRLKLDPTDFFTVPMFTPDHDTVELPPKKAKGIELQLALVDFLLTLGDQQTASRAIKKIAKGTPLLVQQMTPLEVIKEICKDGRQLEDVVSSSVSVAEELNLEGFFDHLCNTDRLLNRDHVNQLLRKESGFSSPSEDMILFMKDIKLSMSDYTLTSIKEKLSDICQIYKKRVAFCSFLVLLSVILVLAGVGISLWLSHHSSNPVNQLMEIGDIRSSSALIPVPNNVSLVSLKSLNTLSEVMIFWASFIPPTGTQILKSRIPHSSGCTPYNVNTGDRPVYLLPGSIMNYNLTVSGLNNSKCMAQLVLFNNRAEYLSCNYNSSSVVKAYCLTNGPVNVSIMISKSANYYAILVTDDSTISVSSDITVHQVYYNTSHLSTAKSCQQISNDASCTVHNPDIKKWSCSNTGWYMILQSSSNAEVEYNYKTPSYDYCHMKICLIIVIASVVSVFCIVLLLILIGYCVWKNCKKTGSRVNGNIQCSRAGYDRIS